MADPSSRSNDSVHSAVERGDEEAVKRLLEQCRDLDKALDEDGNTALHLACTKGFHRIVELLLDHGASVHTTNGFGCTPLDHAAFHSTADTVALLLQRGADVRAVDQYGNTPLHAAATVSKESSTIKLLLNNRADIEVENIKVETPLATAIYYGNTRAAEVLISSGANVHWRNAKRGGCDTLLHVAAEKWKTATLRLLLNANLEVDTVVGLGKTPLQTAASRDYCLDSVEFLLRNGARVNYRDQARGFTALHFAVRGQATRNLELLFEYGADLNVKDNNGQTPLGLAVGLSRSEMYPAFAKQLVMMKAQNWFISESNLKTLSEDDELKSCSASCEAEVKEMSKSRIGDSNVKVSDLFSKGENRLTRYSANKHVEQYLADGSYEAEFPIYANVIFKKFIQGRERRDLLRRSSEYLFGVINEFYELPQECVEIINRWLPNVDLKLQIK